MLWKLRSRLVGKCKLDPNYRPISVKHQLRCVLLQLLRSGIDPLSRIDGRDQTKSDVIRTLLSGANLYLVSREGTGKTLLAETLAELLPPIPKIRGCPYNDDPLWPRSKLCPRCAESEDPIGEFGIEYIAGRQRFSRIQGNEYTTEAKLLGVKDIQAIVSGEHPTDPKVFTGTGIFRGNRGIVFVDELPAIPTKVQVLFHPLLQEGKIVLEEYGWERELDIVFIATGNPEGFSHVNRIPEPLLDRLEMVCMDLPDEDVERRIMIKERFHPQSQRERSLSSEINLDLSFLPRSVVVPWWILDLINKSVRYTRICPNLERGASIRGPIRSLDHACSGAEMEGARVVNLKHACSGLKLGLRGRIKPRPDLIFDSDPEQYFGKLDRIIEDIVWHALKKLSSHILESLDYDRSQLRSELESVLMGKSEIGDGHPELDRILGWMGSQSQRPSIPEDIQSKLKSDPELLREWISAGFDFIASAGIHKLGIPESLVRKRVYLPQRLEKSS